MCLVTLLIKPIQVFLQGGSPCQNVNFTTQVDIIGKFYKVTLDPNFQVT